MNIAQFQKITLTGKDASKFLQGQLTVNVNKLDEQYLPAAICNLKGRVQFGLWVNRRNDEEFSLIISADCMAGLLAHIKKYGAFSKIALSDPAPIFPCVVDGLPTFSNNETDKDWDNFAKTSLELGNYWLTADTAEQFQPQELRLHQRGGVDYDKGCYLGQEIVARLWFKASPKAWLHRIVLTDDLNEKIQIVCEFDGQALVVARPDDLVGVEVLTIGGLAGEVGRSQT